eukprot:Amastigsp_a853_21.p5 type:complete len:102 gc:universal Amastigsp_a853_21:652-347(-)
MLATAADECAGTTAAVAEGAAATAVAAVAGGSTNCGRTGTAVGTVTSGGRYTRCGTTSFASSPRFAPLVMSSSECARNECSPPSVAMNPNPERIMTNSAVQ